VCFYRIHLLRSKITLQTTSTTPCKCIAANNTHMMLQGHPKPSRSTAPSTPRCIRHPHGYLVLLEARRRTHLIRLLAFAREQSLTATYTLCAQIQALDLLSRSPLSLLSGVFPCQPSDNPSSKNRQCTTTSVKVPRERVSYSESIRST